MTRLPGTFALSITALALSLALLGFTTEPASVPPGTYTTTFTANEIPPEFPAEARSNLAGHWKLKLTEGERFSVAKGGEIIAEGRYNFTREQFVLTDEKGKASCAAGDGTAATGTYQWAFDGKKLTFTVVEDDCPGRRFVLTFHPLMKET